MKKLILKTIFPVQLPTNFPIQPNTLLAEKLLSLQLLDYHSAIRYIQNLPYGRNSERTNPMLILTEAKGTCSSKHACLKQIALDHNQLDIDLVIGIYRMNNINTPGIGSVLEDAGLAYVPEAHCYLKQNGVAFDFTNPSADFSRLAADILEEQIISVDGVGVYKVEYHQKFVKEWCQKEGRDFDFERIWAIREACIERLSQ